MFGGQTPLQAMVEEGGAEVLQVTLKLQLKRWEVVQLEL